MNLGRPRLLRAGGRPLQPVEISGLQRTLDLWTGVQTSRYQIAGQPVAVETCVHPSLDMVAVLIESPLVESGELDVVRKVDADTYHASLVAGEHCSVCVPEAGGVKKKLVITRAEYGAGDQWLDVSEHVATTVHNARILQPVNLQSMGSHPAKERTKRMKVTYTLAMGAANWDGAPDKHAPGSPDDGSWVVKWEGLKQAP